VRRFIPQIVSFLLLLALQPGFGQKTNKPFFKGTGGEPLGEKDNSFAGSGTNKRGFFSKGLFAPKKGFEHAKKTQHFTKSKKADRSSFQKKHVGKKGLFGRRRSGGWGGNAFKTNGKEDKRLFSGSKKRRKK